MTKYYKAHSMVRPDRNLFGGQEFATLEEIEDRIRRSFEEETVSMDLRSETILSKIVGCQEHWEMYRQLIVVEEHNETTSDRSHNH